MNGKIVFATVGAMLLLAGGLLAARVRSSASSGPAGDACCCAQTAQATGGHALGTPQQAAKPAPVAMPKPGEKVWVGTDRYFVYGFDRTPKMGTVILKVELYTREGARDTSLQILGSSDMPSMRGAHSMGEQPFKLSNKGDYLMPLAIVMPGEWEVVISVLKEGKVAYAGYHRFKV